MALVSVVLIVLSFFLSFFPWQRRLGIWDLPALPCCWARPICWRCSAASQKAEMTMSWPAQRVWSVLAEHFVQPVEHDAVLEAEVVELAVQECAVLGCEDLMPAGWIGCRLDGGCGLPVQLFIVAGIVEAQQRALDLLRLGHQPAVPAPGFASVEPGCLLGLSRHRLESLAEGGDVRTVEYRQDRVAVGHVGVGDAGGDPGFAGRGADRHPASGLAPAVEGDAGGIDVAAVAQVVDAGAY